MRLECLSISNFRRLKSVHIKIEKETTIFVGANNSGKTSATQILQLFLGSSKDKFSIHDFSADSWRLFDEIGAAQDDTKLSLLPKITLDLWFNINETDLHRVLKLLPGLDWNKSLIGVRLEFAAKDPSELVKKFRSDKTKAEVLASKSKEKSTFHPWPQSLTDYLAKKISTEFQINYFVLDHSKFDGNFKEAVGYLPSVMGATISESHDTLKTLLRVDFLNAQRHLSDNAASSRAEDLSRHLSRFYERNLKQREEDFEILKALNESENQLNLHLGSVFEPTLKRLSELGYPGVENPNLIIRSALDPATLLRQDAKVHYALSGPDGLPIDMTLPDKYNGLGYKNLIYMVIELLDCHTRWVQDEARPPLHLIVIEEPEAHLHAQLQQVFIKNVVKILENATVDPNHFAHQMLITTHSPHIIYECGFTPIRYFRRCARTFRGQTSDVLNLSTFYENSEKESREFLQRYMKLTHCDLFFADGAVLVEGNVERLLLPAMIEKSVPELQKSYLSVLEVGGAFAHRFRLLIEFLGLPSLVITDLDSVTALDDTDEDGQDIEPEEEEEGTYVRGKACAAHTKDAVTSNQTLRSWMPKIIKVAELLTAGDEKKLHKKDGETSVLAKVV